MEKILIAGGTGLIGQRIIELLDKSKYTIHVLSRSKKQDQDNIRYFQWNINTQEIEHEALDIDHIINLTGAGIADKRWTDDRKKLLISSRVDSTLLIKKGLESSGFRPKSYVSASAIGFYGDSGSKLMQEEDNPVDDGFLSTCTVAWEKAALQLDNCVDRLAIIRIGIVLSSKDGAFQKMLIPFKLGMASYFGNGAMNYSWIHIDDVSKLFIHILKNENTQGIYNAVAPQVVSNKTLIQSIKKHRKGISFNTHR